MVRFLNQTFRYQALDKKMKLHKLDKKRLGFSPVKALYFSKNLTPTNQLLTWKHRELKRASDSQYVECLGCDKNKENC